MRYRVMIGKKAKKIALLRVVLKMTIVGGEIKQKLCVKTAWVCCLERKGCALSDGRWMLCRCEPERLSLIHHRVEGNWTRFKE